MTSSSILDVADGASLRLGNVTTSASRTITKTGSGALTIAGAQSHAAGAAITVNGGTLNLNSNAGPSGLGMLTLNANATVNIASRQNLAALNIGAVVVVSVAGGGGNVINARTLSVSSGGKLDLANNAMIVTDGVKGVFDGVKYTGITGSIASGYDFGDWNGAGGIVTSMPDAAGGLTTLAVADADEVNRVGSTFAGVTANSGDVLLMYTYAGDANALTPGDACAAGAFPPPSSPAP